MVRKVVFQKLFMNKAYLLIGGNMGLVRENLALARERLEQKVGHITRTSSIYQTAAWGLEDQPDFLNQVLLIESALGAEDMLHEMLSIELQMGRVRNTKNGPRLIDIDLLFFNDAIIDLPDLKVPHPLLHTRNFTLLPLVELAPDLIHPVLGKSIRQLTNESPDQLSAVKLKG